MTIGKLLALIAIILAFVVAIVEEKVLFGVTDWLILAIALSLWDGPVVFKKGA